MNQISSIKQNKAGRPTREQAQARQAELLEAAIEQFCENGFDRTTIETIASDVSMTKRTVYARFEDKASLFRAALKRAIESYSVPLDRIVATRSKDLKQSLTNIAMLRIRLVSEERGLKLQRLIEREAYRFPDIFQMSYELGAGPTVRFLAGMLTEETQAGRLAIDDPLLAANVFMSMVVSGPVRFITSGNALTEDELHARVAFAVRLFLEGAKPR